MINDGIKSGRNWAALNLYDTDDILQLGTANSNVRERWLPWIMLSKIAPGANVVIPKGGYFNRPEVREDFIFSARLHSFGDVSTISKTNLTSDEILKGTNPENFIVASIENMPDGSPYYAFAAKTDTVTELSPSPIRGVATSNNLRPRPGANVVLVEWRSAPSTFHPTENFGTPEFYALIIDTNLLKDDVQSQLLESVD